MDTGENPYSVASLAPAQDQHGSSRRSPFPAALNFGLQTFVNHFPVILAVTAVVWGPLEILQAYFEYFVFDEDDIRATFRMQRVLDNFFGIIVTGAVLAIGQAAHRGERLSPWQALSKGLAAWGRLFWTRLLRGILLLVAFLALIIPGIYVGFRLMLVESVVLVEHKSGMDAINRAWQLAKDRFWLITCLTLASSGVVMVVSILLFVPLGLFSAIDHWLLSAALSLVVDLISQIPTLILLGVYFQATVVVNEVVSLPVSSSAPQDWAFLDSEKG